MGHARPCSRSRMPKTIEALAQRIITDGLSVRDVESQAKRPGVTSRRSALRATRRLQTSQRRRRSTAGVGNQGQDLGTGRWGGWKFTFTARRARPDLQDADGGG
jgi:hypothetical protein